MELPDSAQPVGRGGCLLAGQSADTPSTGRNQILMARNYIQPRFSTPSSTSPPSTPKSLLSPVWNDSTTADKTGNDGVSTDPRHRLGVQSSRREEDKEEKVSRARQRCRFLVSLSNSKHPTLLAPLAALGGQTKRRMLVRKKFCLPTLARVERSKEEEAEREEGGDAQEA
ncbi:unnamed protein product [Pleuronectes platessa]|uniref:Uncharacterized protein n=1 Tax=Pleuronectes platessa TaxID=8262 RepID=A0A9N7YCH6_PLEPL|nr:unnamed protein product [Pleuronectes platessa]